MLAFLNVPQILSLALAVSAAAVPGIHARAGTIGDTQFDVISPVVGYPHGKGFDDEVFSGEHNRRKRPRKITLGPCGDGEHLSYIGMDFSRYGADVEHVDHGTMATGSKTVELDFKYNTDRITRVRLATWKAKAGHNWHTRIGWMEITSTIGTITCGAKNPQDTIYDWGYPGNYLVSFKGSQGDALDALQGQFMDNMHYSS